MPNCVACGAEPFALRTPHTVYVKILHLIAGPDYCRHHSIGAAVAAGLVTEVRPGAGLVAATSQGAIPTNRDRPFPV